MRVTVFGASGKVGQQVVALELGKGYSVTAFVHSHNPFKANKDLKIVTGGIEDQLAIGRALEDSDAVISALGSWHTKSKRVLTCGMNTIIPTMEEQGIRRIITVTGTGALWSGDKPSALDKLNHSLLKLVAPKVLLDGEEHIRLLAASKLDWTCVRSPVMTRDTSTKYRLRLKLPGPLATIPRSAVAQCLVDRLETRDYIRAAPVMYRA
ncbi:MAG TPA: NAD(P)H-binding protein [Verrucomicrobiae bacterium]|nr:NAD(P)H-binding protein [Verrucomicrobiae bacterium]